MTLRVGSTERVSSVMRPCPSLYAGHADSREAHRSKASRVTWAPNLVPRLRDTAQRPVSGGVGIAMPRDFLQEKMTDMATMTSQYAVVELTPNGHPWREQVQHLLNEHACEGWELVTTIQAEGVTPRPVDQMIRSLSYVPS